jgi:hypothetical protein
MWGAAKYPPWAVPRPRAGIYRRTGEYACLVEITGTIEAPDGRTDHIIAQGASYEEAKVALEAAVPEGTKLIVIRTDR